MKYFLGFLASIALIILVVFLIIKGLSGGKDTVEPTGKKLADYAKTNTEVSLLVDGTINADELHSAYRITVGRDQAVIETYQGYEETIIASQVYENNPTSYANFLRALELAGFNKGESIKGGNDYRGVCAKENRFILQIQNGTSELQKFWTTSCGGGSFKGDISQVRQLFIRQAPDYQQLTRKLHL